eukprot:g17114.t1
MGAAQLATGSIFVLPLSILRLRNARSGVTMIDIKPLGPIAVCHMLWRVCVIVSVGADAVRLGLVVRAIEPLFTALLSVIFMKQTFSPLVYLALVPVVAGVGLTAIKNFEFTWPVFIAAVGYNLASSTRAILSKRAMGKDMGEKMTPGNLHAALNTMATAMLLPLSAVEEGPKIQDLDDFVYNVVASGVFFYLHSEVVFWCLGRVRPVTHAVGNTFKRVFLLAVSIIVFGTKLTCLEIMGSYLAVMGVHLYRLAGKRDGDAKDDLANVRVDK